MKPIDNDQFELSTGRRFYANNQIIGLSETGETYGGYDQDINTTGFWEFEAGKTEMVRVNNWSTTECLELALYMISRWTIYAATIMEKGSNPEDNK